MNTFSLATLSVPPSAFSHPLVIFCTLNLSHFDPSLLPRQSHWTVPVTMAPLSSVFLPRTSLSYWLMSCDQEKHREGRLPHLIKHQGRPLPLGEFLRRHDFRMNPHSWARPARAESLRGTIRKAMRSPQEASASTHSPQNSIGHLGTADASGRTSPLTSSWQLLVG